MAKDTVIASDTLLEAAAVRATASAADTASASERDVRVVIASASETVSDAE
jgi:hypothetical protein